MRIANNATELVGNTPLVRLNKVVGGNATVLAKIEAFNPGFSIKDRIALNMIEEAERSGELEPGTPIIEATSGNTGIGLAWVAAVKGYPVIITVSARNSPERITMLRALGAKVVVTPADQGTPGAIEEANRIAASLPKAFLPRQHWNLANPAAHYQHTAMEIWQDTEGRVDIFVAGFGTGGTITGVGQRLKELKPEARIVAVEPEESPVLSQGRRGSHGIQGISPGFVPEVLRPEVIDEVVLVSTDAAVAMAQRLMREEGLLVGISSGANATAAGKLAERPENAGKLIVTVFPDLAERYLSTRLFAEAAQAT
ncbi:MAG TPA: cysteine synthase A [Thermomicrobiaceae bacterium]|nr:cysteine synthase A [Thermomicrobiaceae bacterium]